MYFECEAKVKREKAGKRQEHKVHAKQQMPAGAGA
jgi:hypothetical protein